MPYVTQDRRVGLREPIDELVSTLGEDSQLCVLVAKIALLYHTDRLSKLVVEELVNRANRDEDITGDINFCICRLLVGYTHIHTDPRYWKVNLINRVLRKAQKMVSSSTTWFSEAAIERAESVIDDVRLELYSRYAVDYELKKCAENGDIMEDRESTQ